MDTMSSQSSKDKAARRQQMLLNHLTPRPPCTSTSLAINSTWCEAHSDGKTDEINDEVAIISAVRTPICRAFRGGFKDTSARDLLSVVLKAVVERTGVNPGEVGDIAVGMVLGPSGKRTKDCRMAMLEAGFPEHVPIRSVNRQCGSGLQAIADIAACIKAGFIDIGIGAGVESMTSDYRPGWKGPINPKVETDQRAKDCLLPMGLMSENVASTFGISREEQDYCAVLSHKRALSASSRFEAEIVPVKTKVIDSRTGEENQITVLADDGIRQNANMEDLSKLKPAFKADGLTTAGNSSQVSDGASAVLLMKRSSAMQRRFPILGVFKSYAVVGVGPAINGIGPVYAIPKAVKQAGLQLKDVSLFEINEAFASQYVYCCKELGLSLDRVNVNGGAIALGHPLGATGARCVATLLYEMQQQGITCKYGVISMCIGSGMGAAVVLERGPMDDVPINFRFSKI